LFVDTDTLYVEFKAGTIAGTCDLDENTLLEVDANGQLVALTIEHASERNGIPAFTYEQVAA
jgi:uncharacterized protein YuzE